MIDDRAVVVEGGEPGLGSPRRPSGPWKWLAAGLVLGFGMGLVVLTDRGEDPAVPSPEDGIARPESPVVAVRDHVPGFSGELVVMAVGEDEGLEMIRWPADGEARSTPVLVPLDSRVAFDVSGEWYLAASPMGGNGRMFLTVGRGTPQSMSAVNVTGYAWHDTTPGVLSWSTQEGAAWALHRASVPDDDHEVDLGLVEGDLTGLGLWGYALWDGVSSLLVDDSGAVIAEMSGGVVADSHPDLGVVIVDHVNVDILDQGLIVRPDASFHDIEPLDARVSPDGTKLAVVGRKGVKVAPSRGSGEVMVMWTGGASTSIAWTPDSRYVLVPLVRGVAVIDTRLGGVPVTLLPDRQVLAVGAASGGP